MWLKCNPFLAIHPLFVIVKTYSQFGVDKIVDPWITATIFMAPRSICCSRAVSLILCVHQKYRRCKKQCEKDFFHKFIFVQTKVQAKFKKLLFFRLKAIFVVILN